MKTWIVTDTHLGHAAMVGYCGRPEDHSEYTLLNLASINPGDTLIHLGDICIGRDAYWHDKLRQIIRPGVRRILVKGNHDHKSNAWYLDQGWDFVCFAFTDVYFGKKMVFSHIPENPMIGDINVHGHLHNQHHRDSECSEYYDPSYHKKLSHEEQDLRPILLEKFIFT